MNLRRTTLEYLGWCPGVKSASRFIPDRDKKESWRLFFTKRNLVFLLGIIGLFSVIIIYGNGILVPVREPFVNLEIVVEKDTYRVGEEVKAKFLLKNMMPFPVRINFNSDVIKKGYYADTQEGFTGRESRLRNQNNLVMLGIGSALFGDETVSFIPSRPGDYIFYFEVEGMELIHTIEIEE